MIICMYADPTRAYFFSLGLNIPLREVSRALRAGRRAKNRACVCVCGQVVCVRVGHNFLIKLTYHYSAAAVNRKT